MNAYTAYWQARNWKNRRDQLTESRGYEPQVYRSLIAESEARSSILVLELAGGEKPPHPCCYPGCQNSIRARGLCHQHYQSAIRYLRDGKADEDDLMARGLILKAGNGGGPTEAHGAFLEGSREVGVNYAGGGG